MALTSALPTWLADALDSLTAGDIDGWMEIYEDDAAHEFPFAREGAPKRLEGKSTIAEYMSEIVTRVQFDSFDDLRVREAGDELIIEANGHGTRPATGAPFHMQYVWFITHHDGRVSRLRDYMNPL